MSNEQHSGEGTGEWRLSEAALAEIFDIMKEMTEEDERLEVRRQLEEQQRDA